MCIIFIQLHRKLTKLPIGYETTFFSKVSFDVYCHFFLWLLFYECISVAFKQMEILIFQVGDWEIYYRIL